MTNSTDCILLDRATSGRKIVAAALAAAALAIPAPASANGRFPAAGLIAVDPSDPSHVIVRATYGVLSTRDAGQTWSWMCEAAVGYGGYEDPMIAILADGTLIAGLFDGLSASRDDGCGWSFAGGGLADRYVIDLSAERADPSKAVLVTSTGIGSGQFLTQLWESSDNGGTWAQAGVDLPQEFLALTVDVAPSEPSRVVVSGRFGAPGYPGALLRTLDRGQTWERFDIPGSDDKHLPYLSAIDPSDADVLYVRLDGEPTDSLLVSKDGGATFMPVFDGQGSLSGFALSPDGATVLVGGEQDGVWRGPTSTLTFEKVSSLGVRCMTWVDAGVFACADEFADGFTVGVSQDEGSSFAPMMHLSSLCGPLECGPETSVGSLCPPLWGATKLTIGAEDCGASSASGATSGPGPSPGGVDDGGCACRSKAIAGAGRENGWLVVTIASAFAGALRFRRREPSVRARAAVRRGHGR
ncbi:hypothetical protein WMF11_25015 [Sorangium sp. So ce295]|uniref:WD40/YVTN/BNR-like repeat-containing protein n=1 Tax=Sorangium sp. So ce295 TaxID=3133295 RepID=UPI003F5DD89E